MKKGKTESILFIGNSFSYFHALPKLAARFVRLSGLKLTADGVFRGGATLKMLWEDGHALKKIRGRSWDYVVLQERGRLSGLIKDGVVHVGKSAEFAEYAAKFDKEIKKINAQTILYCPPAFLGKGLLADAKKLHAAYEKLAAKMHVPLISAETAFISALQKRPRLNLYERDDHHPNPLGMYLIACLFYRKLTHKKAAHLPFESYSSQASVLPKNPKTVRLSESDARFLWSIVNNVF